MFLKWLTLDTLLSKAAWKLAVKVCLISLAQNKCDACDLLRLQRSELFSIRSISLTLFGLLAAHNGDSMGKFMIINLKKKKSTMH